MLRVPPTAALTLLLLVQTSGQTSGQTFGQTSGQTFGQTSGQDLAQTSGRPAKPLSLTQVWTLDATYTDPQHGVTFRHPSTWEATTQFGYHPPRLTQSEATPIAGFGYSEGGFPRERIVGPYTKTNMEGVGIVYSAVPAATAAECEAKAATLSHAPRQAQVVFGQRSFSVYQTEGIGMSQSIEGRLYVTYAGSNCYLFETDVAVSSPGALDDIKALTPAQLRSIDIHLQDIMHSVKIVPRG